MSKLRRIKEKNKHTRNMHKLSRSTKLSSYSLLYEIRNSYGCYYEDYYRLECGAL
jgi:hypothetical protein